MYNTRTDDNTISKETMFLVVQRQRKSLGKVPVSRQGYTGSDVKNSSVETDLLTYLQYHMTRVACGLIDCAAVSNDVRIVSYFINHVMASETA